MDWKEKSLLATRGTKFDAVIACVLGRDIPAPCFNGKASVTSDGFVMCSYTHNNNGERHMGAFVGSFNDIQRNAIGLADHLKLTDKERGEYAATLAGWIGVDYYGAAIKLRNAIAKRRN